MKTFLKTLGIFLLLLVGGVFTLWVRPEILLTDGNINSWARKLLSSKDVSLGDVQIHLQTRKAESFFSKHISLELSQGCIESDAEGIRICIKHVKLEGVLRPLKFSQIITLEKARAEIADAVVYNGTTVADTGANEGPTTLPEDLHDVFQTIQQIATIIFKSKTDLQVTAESISVREKKELLPRTKNDVQILNAKLRNREQSSIFLDAETISIGSGTPSKLEASVKLSPFEADGLQGMVTGILKNGSLGKSRAQIIFSPTKNGKSDELNFKINTELWKNKQKQLATDQCEILVRKQFEHLKVQPCTLVVDISTWNKDPQFARNLGGHKFTVPLQLEVHSTSKNWELKTNLGPFGNSIFSADIQSELRRDWKKEKGTSNGELVQQWVDGATGKVEIHKFQLFQKVLAVLGFEIPAPFSALDGKAELQIKDEPTPGVVAVELKTDFASPQQQLGLTAFARMENIFEEKNRKLLVDVNIFNAQIVLPPAQKKAPELTVIPDGRFKKEAVSATKNPMQMDLHVRGRNIRLISENFSNPIPFSIDLNMHNGELQHAQIAIENFDFKTLRRNIKIVSAQLDITPNQKEVDVLATLKHGEYDIVAKVIGPMKKPRLILSSTPPLSRSEILSVVLFGKKIEALDEDSRNSVSNTETALADGALSFTSLYLFASTPVQSVTYNPETRVASSQVMLRDGTTITLGVKNLSEWSDLELRQSLGKGWYVNTGVFQEERTDATGIAALLEKVFRY